MENLKIVSIKQMVRGVFNNDIAVMTESDYYEFIKQLKDDMNVEALDHASYDMGLVKFKIIPRAIMPRECYEARYCIVKYIVMKERVSSNQAVVIELKDLNETLMQLHQAQATVIDVNTILTQSRTHCIVHSELLKETLMSKLFIKEVKKNGADKFDITVYVKDYDKTYTYQNEQEIALDKIYDLVLVSLIEDADNKEE